MPQHWALFALIFLVSAGVFAQDERYYRQIITGELPVTAEPRESFVRSLVVLGPEYMVDLNADGVEEVLRPEKRDGIDYLTILNSSRSPIFSAKFFAAGGESSIYKLRLVNLSATAKALIVFVDEGATRGLRFESTARIYFLSFDNNDLSTLALNPGPHIFQEREGQREQYWRRQMSVDVRDLDGDHKREIVVHFGHIQHVYEYAGSGTWTKF